MITLNGVVLPAGLVWQDLDYSAIKQIETESVTGHLIIQRGTMQEGRPINLIGGDNLTWLLRSEAEVISALRTELGYLTLSYHGTTYKVRFKLSDADHFKVRGVFSNLRVDEPDTKCYIEQIKLVEVIA